MAFSTARRARASRRSSTGSSSPPASMLSLSRWMARSASSSEITSSRPRMSSNSPAIGRTIRQYDPCSSPRSGADVPDDLPELVSFEDPDEERTWVFDVTCPPSPWTGMYARGCKGVLTGPAEELEQGCCSYGAHFVDEED